MASRIVGTIVFLTFILATTFILTRNDYEPEKLPLISGCFESADAKTTITISRNGNVVSGKMAVKADIVRDKTGLSVLPNNRIERKQDGGLIKTSGSPLKITIKRNYNELIFDDSDESFVFRRKKCATGVAVITN